MFFLLNLCKDNKVANKYDGKQHLEDARGSAQD